MYKVRYNLRTLVVIRVPVPVAIDVGVSRDPSMNALCGRFSLVREHLWMFFVFTIHGNSGDVRYFLALRMILDYLPVFFDRDVYIAKLDFAHFFLLYHSELLPFD